jgi:hypothetical protein
VDDYDSVLNQYFRRSSVTADSLKDINRELVDQSIVKNKNARVILAGYFPDPNMIGLPSFLLQHYLYSNCLAVDAYTILSAGEYASFFGFNSEDYDELCKTFAITKDDKAAVKRW